MSISNSLLLLARDVTVDANDKMMTVIKIIDNFNGNVNTKSEDGEKPDEVVIPVNFAIVSSWSYDEKQVEPTSLTIKTNIADANEQDLGGPEQTIELPAGIQKFNLNFPIQGLKATGSGTYVLTAQLLDSSDKLLASAQYSFEVNLHWHHDGKDV